MGQLNGTIEQQGLLSDKIEKLALHRQCKEGNLVLSTFRLKCEAVLNYVHTRDQSKECILCWIRGVYKINSGKHIFFECQELKSFRKEAKMETKINSLKNSGIDEEDIYRRYINGETLSGERGK